MCGEETEVGSGGEKIWSHDVRGVERDVRMSSDRIGRGGRGTKGVTPEVRDGRAQTVSVGALTVVWKDTYERGEEISLEKSWVPFFFKKSVDFGNLGGGVEEVVLRGVLRV